MEAKQYLDSKKTLQKLLLDFLDNQDDDQKNYNSLISDIQKQNITENKNELQLFLKLLVNISSNHYRYPNFFIKIDQILSFLNQKIKQTFSNIEIFAIFKSNNRLLLFFIKNNFFVNDEQVMKIINKFDYFNNSNDSDEDHEEKREIGENDSYICKLIREDSIIPFIKYVNQTNIVLSSRIKNSIYETNSLLYRKKVTLLEYATFFGSIQIFRYLMMNNCRLTQSLWPYAIHSNNPEIIHLLEENKVDPILDKNNLLTEAIKCHHNDIANYMEENYFHKGGLASSFRFYNFEFLSEYEVDDENFLLYSCEFNYTELVKNLLESKKVDMFNDEIIIFSF